MSERLHSNHEKNGGNLHVNRIVKTALEKNWALKIHLANHHTNFKTYILFLYFYFIVLYRSDLPIFTFVKIADYNLDVKYNDL